MKAAIEDTALASVTTGRNKLRADILKICYLSSLDNWRWGDVM